VVPNIRNQFLLSASGSDKRKLDWLWFSNF